MNATRRVRVASKSVKTPDISCFELVAAEGQPLPPLSAGSHIDVLVAPGLVRQYSLCNAPGETHRYVIAVLRDPKSRGGSAAMHALAPGQELRISDPKNHFPLVHDAPHTLLLAGGIWITPILGMAQHLWNVDAPFELRARGQADGRGVAACDGGPLLLGDEASVARRGCAGRARAARAGSDARRRTGRDRMTYPRNQWYVAGFDDELPAQQLLARTFLGHKGVLFRAPDGTPCALEDRCPPPKACCLDRGRGEHNMKRSRLTVLAVLLVLSDGRLPPSIPRLTP